MKNDCAYILNKCESFAKGPLKILDYGCGQGSLVEEGLRRGLDIYGVEAFSKGSGANTEEILRIKGLLHKRVKVVNSGQIDLPFPDNTFDLIISNQVFEHLEDIDCTLNEIDRILHKDGTLLLLFPTWEIFKEGHSGLLFAHWFPKSRLRYYWLLVLRFLGFGNLKDRMRAREFAHFFNCYLSEQVHYRKIKTVHRKIAKYLPIIEHFEEEYVSFALKKNLQGRLAQICLKFPVNVILRLLTQRWFGLVFIAKRVVAV